MKRFIFAAMLAVSAMAGAQVDPNRVVASVNGDDIKGADYYHRTELMPMNPRLEGVPAGFFTLITMIRERLILQLARQNGASPSQAELDDYRKSIDEDRPDWAKKLTAQGYTPEDIFWNVKVELAEFKLRTRGVTITDQEVEKFYKDNPTIFTIPKRLKIRVIAVNTPEEMKAVDADLSSGKSFADVAKSKSLDVTAPGGGMVGVIPVPALPEAAQNALASVKVGSSTAWLEQRNVHVKYYLEEALPAQKQDLTPALKRTWRRKLMLDKGAVVNDFQKSLDAFRATAKIEIKQPEWASMYQQFVQNIDQLEKAGGAAG